MLNTQNNFTISEALTFKGHFHYITYTDPLHKYVHASFYKGYLNVQRNIGYNFVHEKHNMTEIQRRIYFA